MIGAAEPALPTILELGRDLFIVSPTQVAISLFRPAFCFALFWRFARTHHYLFAAGAAAGLMFFTYTSTSHDWAHRTLHLPKFWNYPGVSSHRWAELGHRLEFCLLEACLEFVHLP